MFNIIDTRVNALDAKINAYLILFRYDYSRNKGLLILENGASYLIGSYICKPLSISKVNVHFIYFVMVMQGVNTCLQTNIEK